MFGFTSYEARRLLNRRKYFGEYDTNQFPESPTLSDMRQYEKLETLDGDVIFIGQKMTVYHNIYERNVTLKVTEMYGQVDRKYITIVFEGTVRVKGEYIPVVHKNQIARSILASARRKRICYERD